MKTTIKKGIVDLVKAEDAVSRTMALLSEEEHAQKAELEQASAHLNNAIDELFTLLEV